VSGYLSKLVFLDHSLERSIPWHLD
jgi:hypothetical protein